MAPLAGGGEPRHASHFTSMSPRFNFNSFLRDGPVAAHAAAASGTIRASWSPFLPATAASACGSRTPLRR